MFTSSCWTGTSPEAEPLRAAVALLPLHGVDQFRPAIEDRQNFVSLRRRQADHYPRDAQVTVALQPAEMLWSAENCHGHGCRIAPGLRGHLSKARQIVSDIGILRPA